MSDEDDLEAELTQLHNTCGQYERELARLKRATVPVSALRALVRKLRNITNCDEVDAEHWADELASLCDAAEGK